MALDTCTYEYKKNHALSFFVTFAPHTGLRDICRDSQSYAKPLFTTKAKFAILIDAETGSVLYAKNA